MEFRNYYTGELGGARGWRDEERYSVKLSYSSPECLETFQSELIARCLLRKLPSIYRRFEGKIETLWRFLSSLILVVQTTDMHYYIYYSTSKNLRRLNEKKRLLSELYSFFFMFYYKRKIQRLK